MCVSKIFSQNLRCAPATPSGPNFMVLLTSECCAYDHDSPLNVQAPNFCAYAQKPKFAANPGNVLAVSTEFPASVSADFVLTVSRAMKLGPGELAWNDLQIVL